MGDLLSEGVKPLHLVYVSTDDPMIADKANFFPQIEKFIQERILRQPLQEFEGTIKNAAGDCRL
jgi:hypothetical protein